MFEGFEFKLAEASEQPGALDLRRRVYATDWPGVPENAVIDGIDARADHFIARNICGEIVAAFRVVPPDQRPFDIEHFARVEDFLSVERVPAEIGRLCVRHDNRSIRSYAFVHLGLFKLAFEHAARLSLTDFLLKAAPRLKRFYETAGFRSVGTVIQHPVYGEEHVMRLDIIAVRTGSIESSTAITRYLSQARGSDSGT